MTGAEFGLLISERIGHDYSAYFDAARTNDLIKEGFIKGVEKKYATLDSQSSTDELFTLIKTNVSFTPTNNEVLISAIPQYLHVLAIKTEFTVLYHNCIVTGASGATPVLVTVNKIINIRDGEAANFAGVAGNASVNGKRYVKQVYKDYANKNYAYKLYTDEDLLIPLSPSGVYTTSTGSISRLIYNWVKKKNSDTKIDALGEPTVNNPDYEIAQGRLKLLPLNRTCTQIFLDYISVPAVYPDVNDNTIDLETLYSLRFLYYWMDCVAELMGNESRDLVLKGIEHGEEDKL